MATVDGKKLVLVHKTGVKGHEQMFVIVVFVGSIVALCHEYNLIFQMSGYDSTLEE